MATLNGEPVTTEQLQALADTNYGHYTSLRAAGASARGFSHHLHRLSTDCQRVFGVNLDIARVREYVADHARGMRGEYGIRVTIFDPQLKLGRPADDSAPRVLVDIRPAPPLPLPPLKVQARPYSRDLPEVKHIGLFGALTERRAAQLAGYDDALFVAADELVSEGTTWNVGFFDGSDVVWPDADILPGVTMALLRQVHEAAAIRPVKFNELSDLEVAFATNVTVGVRPIAQINDINYPTDHPILATLKEEFEEIPLEPIET